MSAGTDGIEVLNPKMLPNKINHNLGNANMTSSLRYIMNFLKKYKLPTLFVSPLIKPNATLCEPLITTE